MTPQLRALAGEQARTPLEVAELQMQPDRFKRLSRPFWASFAIGAFGLLIFAALLVNTLDRQSITDSEQVFGSVLDERMERLSELTLEYAYWDQAVNHLVTKLDMAWVEKTFVDYMNSGLGIAGVHLLDQNNADRLHLFEGVVTDGSIMTPYGTDAFALINQARRTPAGEVPVPENGLLGTADELFQASAARMTTYTDDDEDISTDHVLMFVKRLDEAALSELAAKFRFPNLEITTEQPSYFQASWPITNSDGIVFARFIWDPDLPGQRLLAPLTIGLLIVYAGMMISARLFLKQASRLVAALEKAKCRTERAKELLASQAVTDVLTGLGNRRDYEQTLDRLSEVANGHREFALICIDLDRFKIINDTLGHETGDEVLKHAGKVLTSLLYPQDRVFRLGGDEFVIVFQHADRNRVIAVANKAIRMLSDPVMVNGHLCRFGASAGIAYSADPVTLLRSADAALYTSKKTGRSRVSIYGEEAAAARVSSGAGS